MIRVIWWDEKYDYVQKKFLDMFIRADMIKGVEIEKLDINDMERIKNFGKEVKEYKNGFIFF
jgi:hypothetical protein